MKTLKVQKIVLYLVLIIGMILTIGPFYWMIVGATNPSGEVLSIPPNFIPGTHLLDNLNNILRRINMCRSLLYSTIITVTDTIFGGLVSASAGFAFAKFQFNVKHLIFSIILLSMMVPYQVL